MARLPRFEMISQPQHVIVRGNNLQIIFVAEEDYQFIWKTLLMTASAMVVRYSICFDEQTCAFVTN